VDIVRTIDIDLILQVYPKCCNAEGAIDDIYTLISTRFSNQSGIVYCLSQRDTEEVANELCKRGLKANSYHANIDANSRSRIHSDWSSNVLQVSHCTDCLQVSHCTDCLQVSHCTDCLQVSHCTDCLQ